MANTERQKQLAKTFYGTDQLNTLTSKQKALIKAIIKDTNKQNKRLAGQK